MGLLILHMRTAPTPEDQYPVSFSCKEMDQLAGHLKGRGSLQPPPLRQNIRRNAMPRKEAVYLTRALGSMKFHIEAPITLYTDNKSAINLAENNF